MTPEQYAAERDAAIALYKRGNLTSEEYLIKMRELRFARDVAQYEDDLMQAGRGHLLGRR